MFLLIINHDNENLTKNLSETFNDISSPKTYNIICLKKCIQNNLYLCRINTKTDTDVKLAITLMTS